MLKQDQRIITMLISQMKIFVLCMCVRARACTHTHIHVCYDYYTCHSFSLTFLKHEKRGHARISQFCLSYCHIGIIM